MPYDFIDWWFIDYWLLINYDDRILMDLWLIYDLFMIDWQMIDDRLMNKLLLIDDWLMIDRWFIDWLTIDDWLMINWLMIDD